MPRQLKPHLLAIRIAETIALVSLATAAEFGSQSRPSDPPATAQSAPSGAEQLSSWNDGAAKKAVVSFVTRVTTEGGPDFVPVAERIATFDNDGTLWSEQPMYVQFAFMLDRVKALAAQHPEWAQQQPFKAVLDGDMKALAASGERGLLELMSATHAGTHDRGVRGHRHRLDRHGATSEDRPAVHRDGLSTHARSTLISARERFQNLRRLRRRCGVHASVGRACLRDSPGTGCWQPCEGEVPDPQRGAGPAPACGDRSHRRSCR